MTAFYAFVAFLVLLDQGTKFWALQALHPGESVPVISGVFHFSLVRNNGIAFGLFQDRPEILFLLITLSLIVLAVFSIRMCRVASSYSTAARVGLVLVLGGAIGNWIDRVRYNAVIDFLDFRVWPVFNLADSAITVGVFIFAWILVRKK
ncbi:MAG: signal peptidase II [Candidatus Omnitrophota bacterium]